MDAEVAYAASLHGFHEVPIGLPLELPATVLQMDKTFVINTNFVLPKRFRRPHPSEETA